MKVLNVLVVSAVAVAALAPDVAFAKKKNTGVPQKMTSEQRSDAINWCRKKYPGPYTWKVEYGIYAGKRQWWCVPSY